MEAFDPYHRWLGIPSEEQPVHLYRLLGLTAFEDDPEVIHDAAERQMAHVRRYDLGKYSALSQQILNQLAGAKARLSDPAQKAEYDRRLRMRLGVVEPVATAVQNAALPVGIPLAVCSAPAARAAVTPKPQADWPQTAAKQFPQPGGRIAPDMPFFAEARAALRRAVADPDGGRLLQWFAALPARIWIACAGATVLSVGGWWMASHIFQPGQNRFRLEPIPNQSLLAGERMLVFARVADAQSWQNRVQFRFADNAPDGAWIDPLGGKIVWTPRTPGRCALAVRASTIDGSKLYDETIFAVDVKPQRPRFASIPEQTIDEEKYFSLPIALENAEMTDTPLQFNLAGGSPSGTQIDPHSGLFTWTPSEQQGPGTYEITVEVLAPGNVGDKTRFTVHVLEVNRPPVLQLPPPQRVAAGGTLKIRIPASDPDWPPNKLTFNLFSGPYWATLDANSGILTCQPPANVPSQTFALGIRVTDDGPTPMFDEKTLEVWVSNGSAPRQTPADFQLVFPSKKILTNENLDIAPRVRSEIPHLCDDVQPDNSRVVYLRQGGPGPGESISDLCTVKQPLVLHGAAVSVYPDLRPEPAPGLNDRPLPGVSGRMVLKRYGNYESGKWHGATAAWDPQGGRQFLGMYSHDKRHGFVCLFQNDELRLVLECTAGRTDAVHVIASYRLTKSFPDEASARSDAEAGPLLDQLDNVEKQLRDDDRALKAQLHRQFNARPSAGRAGAAPGRFGPDPLLDELRRNLSL